MTLFVAINDRHYSGCNWVRPQVMLSSGSAPMRRSAASSLHPITVMLGEAHRSTHRGPTAASGRRLPRRWYSRQ